MENINQDRVSIRYHILSQLDYLIEESIYYRSFSEDINIGSKFVVYNSLDESGKIKIA